ncbi:MAG: 2,3-bisphosphoglycerate-independent phosphoglycerate mutase [Verrucomicrobiae bacterium]|nr:2,3-bisphosphoglycerate-independent phosphoglycerate mutase [Verrucomicrobiae bacterium]
MAKKPVVLIIRDGWGDNPGGQAQAEKNGDVPRLANTPFHDYLYDHYPVSHLSGSGSDVGLPDGQMGNSEVGHLNLGAGRIVYQDLTRINKAVETGSLAQNEVLQEAFAKAKDGGRLHFLGLVSDGGVHSHQDQLIALAKVAHDAGVKDIMVHAITDGRDTSPHGGEKYVSYCEDELAKFGARIGTVIGRYYAMDRDKRWDRVKLAWDAIVHGKGQHCEVLPSAAIADQYRNEKTDEFLLPMIFESPDGDLVRDGDVVLFFNFRADRARELSDAFLDDNFDGFDRGGQPKVHYVTLTEYDEKYDCPVVFGPEELKDTLGQVVGRAGKKQLRIAETEKYPHVSFFFNGGVEEPNPGEDRELIPSPRDVATYDEKPEMSAREVTSRLLAKLPDYDLVILNFANPDMVGHTGDVKAAIKSVECIDECVKAVTEKTLELGGALLITADHGNCDQMINPDGSPNTAHTTNLVHLIYVAADADQFELEDGILADIAPSLLDLMEIEKPEAMTGSTRLKRKV